MKLSKWIFGAMSVALMASCSDKDTPLGFSPNDGGTESISGYLALRINLPQESTTRSGAGDNVEFNDGEEWEYEVANAKILLFTTPDLTTSEDRAKFLDSHDLNRPFAPTSPSDDNISASSLEAVEVDIKESDKSNYLWALVMLNAPTDLETPKAGDTFGDYVEKVTSSSFRLTSNGKDLIFMTNAPLSNKQGGTQRPDSPKVQTLVLLGKAEEILKSTLQEARENVSGCVYVERALAKLTAVVENPQIIMYDKNGVDEEDKTKNKLSVSVLKAEFGMINVNTQSYIVRNVSSIPSNDDAQFAWTFSSIKSTPAYYRMIGGEGMPNLYSPLHSAPHSDYLYRTYWCKDPNYEEEYTPTNDNNQPVFTVAGKTAQYVKENTFTVKNQTYGNTTLGVFKITFKVAGTDDNNDLYILNDNHDVIYTSEKDVTSHVKEYVLAQEDVQNALKKSVKAGINVTGAPLGNYLKIVFTRDSNTGYLLAKDIKLDSDEPGFEDYYDPEKGSEIFQTNLTKDAISDLTSRVNNLFIIEKYEGGVSYYIIPIKHFGDKSTPWTAKETNQTTTEEAYDTNNAARNYLGRYGMVRNNWYEINVTSFTGIGSPVIPKFDADLSDDNNEVKQYIGVETHILSWAKRSQNVKF